MAIVADGDHARSHVADHHGHAQRGHPVGTAALQLSDLGADGIQAADAGTEVYCYPVRRQGADHTAFLHSLNSRAHSVLGVLVTAQCLALVHVVHGIKALDLRSQLCFIIGGIKASDGADAVEAPNQIVPGRFHSASHRADNAQTGHHNSSVFAHIDLLT